MTQATAREVLNRLLNIVCRSLPMYLEHAPPAFSSEDQTATETLERIQSDQVEMAEKIGAALSEVSGGPRLGPFPMEFTDLNDLRARFLLKMAVQYQQRDIADIEQCVEDLRMAPAYQPLAEETLGMAKGHLQELRELESNLPAQTSG